MKADGPGIRRRRETSGYGLRRFATAAGLSASHLSRIERGQSDPQPEVLALIADELGCTLQDLEPETNGGEQHEHALHDDEGTCGSHP